MVRTVLYYKRDNRDDWIRRKMKPKVFRDAVWIFFVIMEVFLSIPWIIFSYGFIVIFCEYANGSCTLWDFIWTLLVQSACSIGGLWMLLGDFLFPRAFGRLLVYEDKVVYKCPFRRKRMLKIKDCVYMGVENYEKLNRGMPIVRGDEISFIYFSNKPYPKEFSGKITALKNSKDFIKFSYTDKLAEAVIEVFPFEQCYLVKSFYGKMKSRDRALKK